MTSEISLETTTQYLDHYYCHSIAILGMVKEVEKLGVDMSELVIDLEVNKQQFINGLEEAINDKVEETEGIKLKDLQGIIDIANSGAWDKSKLEELEVRYKKLKIRLSPEMPHRYLSPPSKVVMIKVEGGEVPDDLLWMIGQDYVNLKSKYWNEIIELAVNNGLCTKEDVSRQALYGHIRRNYADLKANRRKFEEGNSLRPDEIPMRKQLNIGIREGILDFEDVAMTLLKYDRKIEKVDEPTNGDEYNIVKLPTSRREDNPF